MAEVRTTALAALERLRTSLDVLATALLFTRLEDVLAAEVKLALALDEVGRVRQVNSSERQALRAELDRARLALRRCRRLGAALSYVTDASLAAQGRGREYGRTGIATAAGARIGSVHTRA